MFSFCIFAWKKKEENNTEKYLLMNGNANKVDKYIYSFDLINVKRNINVCMFSFWEVSILPKISAKYFDLFRNLIK